MNTKGPFGTAERLAPTLLQGRNQAWSSDRLVSAKKKINSHHCQQKWWCVLQLMWEEVCWIQTKKGWSFREKGKKCVCKKGKAITTTSQTTQGISLYPVQ